MKKFILAGFLAVFALTGTAMAADAAITADKPLKIAVIDLQAVMRDSKAGKSIQDQLEKVRKNFQDDLQRKEEKLRAEDQELTKERAKLSAEEFTKKRRDFEGRVATLQRDAQEKRRQLEQAVGRATNELQGKVFQIVGKIAEDKSISLVLSRTQVFLAQKNFDITPETIKSLDNQLSTIQVSLKPVTKDGEEKK